MKQAIAFEDYDTDDLGGDDEEDKEGEECDGRVVLKDGGEERLLHVSRVGRLQPVEEHKAGDESNDEEGEQCGTLEERHPNAPRATRNA